MTQTNTNKVTELNVYVLITDRLYVDFRLGKKIKIVLTAQLTIMKTSVEFTDSASMSILQNTRRRRKKSNQASGCYDAALSHHHTCVIQNSIA